MRNNRQRPEMVVRPRRRPRCRTAPLGSLRDQEVGRPSGCHPVRTTVSGPVLTSALSEEAARRYEAALARFHDTAEEARRPERERLANHERLADTKNVDEVVLMMPKDKRAAHHARFAAEAKILRESLAKLPLVVWRDPESSRATVLDMVCNKSLYGALTLFDTGCRAARLVSKQGSAARIAECGIAQLAQGGEQGTLIRAQSGGASIFLAAGADRPVLNYYATATPDIMAKLGSRITKRGSLMPLAGSVVAIYGEPEDGDPIVSADEYFRLIERFHTAGKNHKDERRQSQNGCRSF